MWHFGLRAPPNVDNVSLRVYSTNYSCEMLACFQPPVDTSVMCSSEQKGDSNSERAQEASADDHGPRRSVQFVSAANGLYRGPGR